MNTRYGNRGEIPTHSRRPSGGVSRQRIDSKLRLPASAQNHGYRRRGRAVEVGRPPSLTGWGASPATTGTRRCPVRPPDGRMLAWSEPGRETDLVCADLDPALLRQARENPMFALRNRRPDTYGELTRQL